MENYSLEAYSHKVEAIYTRFPSVQKVPFGEGYKPGLGNMLRFSAILGDPHRNYRTIHVAGTNGKGSVANMLAAALSAAGLKVGLYTSPHIIDFRERARILLSVPKSPYLIPREYVFDFLCRYEADMDSLDLSFFEITTGLAFKWFADEGVDVAVIEVGLGGRLDSTNIITPDLSIVTSIALDHCSFLGDTLQSVASEKAGIFKKDVPALVGEYLPETRPVFEERAREVGSPLTFAQDAYCREGISRARLRLRRPSRVNASPGKSLPGLAPVPERVEGAEGRMEEILSRMDLRGKYQRKNLRTVLAALDILKKDPFYSGLEDETKVEEAIERTAQLAGFHGRWERLRENPTVIADIGHNPAALKENFAQLEEMMAGGEFSKLIIVYAVMADKDLDGIMPLMPLEATYIFTNPKTSRALPEKELTVRYKAFRSEAGLPEGTILDFPDVKGALEKAFELASEEPSLIYVGGSTYLVSEVVELFSDSLQGF